VTATAPGDSRSGSLLLVEDDESLRRILARHLRGRGFAVEEAASSEEAVAIIEGGLRPALVLLDLNLPGDTGWDFLRGSALSSAGAPPVVITSATTVSPKRLTEFHIAGYLPKPFPLETLVATVERVISQEGSTPTP
jgi:DNA-binding response OmpR family regulator